MSNFVGCCKHFPGPRGPRGPKSQGFSGTSTIQQAPDLRGIGRDPGPPRSVEFGGSSDPRMTEATAPKQDARSRAPPGFRPCGGQFAPAHFAVRRERALFTKRRPACCVPTLSTAGIGSTGLTSVSRGAMKFSSFCSCVGRTNSEYYPRAAGLVGSDVMGKWGWLLRCLLGDKVPRTIPECLGVED